MWLGIIDGELAFREQEVLDRLIVELGLGTGLGEKLLEVRDFGGELDVVGFDAGIRLHKLGDVVFVLVKDDSGPLVVECSLEEGLTGEIEDSKSEDEGFGEGNKLRERHVLGRDVEGYNVLEKRFVDRGQERKISSLQNNIVHRVNTRLLSYFLHWWSCGLGVKRR